MSDKKKKLCKWDKDKIEKDFDELAKIVSPAKFLCKKCGRVANSEDWLHKPAAIDKK